LRQFNLKTRLFEYPCSYLIYSKAFDGLPDIARDRVYLRLQQILTSEIPEKEYEHLSAENRQAISEILSETKPEYRIKRTAKK
jgi:hypothetical protein